MNDNIKNAKIQTLLHKWYTINKRELPWRDTSNPYIIWISEVILQQTRVDQGHDYFMRFINRFPDIESLASAEEEEVLKLWQGLGYYSRARNLHAAAKDIETRFDGIFPTNYKDVLSLKGIGEYTAAAIVSFSYNLPHAVVDGNVFRVLSRLYAIEEPVDSGRGKRLFTELAQELLDKSDPGTHNQAIMELGALQCVPTNPICEDCPINDFCLSYASGITKQFPVKKSKTLVKERFFNYFNIRFQSHIYLHKRTANDIWKNLYELPLIETDKETCIEELQKTDEFSTLFKDANPQISSRAITLKHVLSHRIIYATFYNVEIAYNKELRENYTETDTINLHKYPISRLVDKYFEKLDTPDLFN